MMKSTLMLVLAAVGGVFSCPSDYAQQAMACYGPLEGAVYGGPDCGIINTTVECFHALEQQCGDNPQALAMFGAMGLQNLAELCRVSQGGCPAITELSVRLQSCLTTFTGPGGCSSMKEGIACIEVLKDQCAQNPNSGAYFQTFPKLQSAYKDACLTSK